MTSSNIDSPALYVNSGGDLTFTANSNSWNITGNSEVHAMGLETQDQFDSMVAQIRNGREDQVSGVSATNDIIVSELDEMYLAALSHFQVNNDSHITNGDLFDSAYLGTEQDPQVVVVDSDIVVAGNTTGYGVLVVNGDFDIRGDFEWNGLVIANLGYGDSFATGRGTSTISGRLWIRSEGNTTVELKGTPTITANDSGYMQNLIENHGVGQGWLPAEYHEIESYYPTGE